jgi:hypothetical protein
MPRRPAFAAFATISPQLLDIDKAGARKTGVGETRSGTQKAKIMAARIFSRLRSFRDAQDGALIIFALFLFVLMAIMGGIAIDLMKNEHIRTQLTQTLDRCTLMAASLNQRLDPEEVVRDCVEKAGLSDTLRIVQVASGMNSRDVKSVARVDSKPFFMHMIGIDTFDAAALSRAEQKITNVEIALVLDVSGSMAGAKIANLRAAASDFVATMMDSDPNRRISISIVPYNAQVNLGPTLLAKYNVTSPHNALNRPTDVANHNCLELPSSVFATAGISRTVELPQMAQSDHYYSTNTGAFYTPPTDASAVPNFNANYCRTEANNVVRMPSQNKAQLQGWVNGLTANGNTSIVLGMKWGTALLDVSARPIYNDFIGAGLMDANLAGRPFEDADPDSMKVIVLMTDGEHVAHDRINDAYKSGPSPIWRSSGDGRYSIFHAAQPGNKYYVPHLNAWRATAWTNNTTPAVQQDWRSVWTNLKLSYVAWQFYGRPYGAAAYNNAINTMRSTYLSVADMNARLQATCKQAKDAGVIVYGIAFEAPLNGQTQISQCATSVNHYFEADGAEIGTAFDTIASNLTMLKLTQ